MPKDATPPDPFANHAAQAVAAGGFFRDLPDHAISYTPGAGQRLVVTFDNLGSLRITENREPWGMAFLAAQGWDVLGVMAKKKDFFRNADLIAAMESLRDEGFFARFPAVSMYGSSMGGYAGIAFAPLAPGCTVMAFAPQSTLIRRIAPFDRRYAWSRKQGDWTGSYRDAATSAPAAGRIYIAYDPHEPEDTAHADRLTGPNTIRLKLPHLGHKIPPELQKMGVMKDISRLALAGELDSATFDRLMRRRRHSWKWVVLFLQRAHQRGHNSLGLKLTEKLLASSGKIGLLRRPLHDFRNAIKPKAD